MMGKHFCILIFSARIDPLTSSIIRHLLECVSFFLTTRTCQKSLEEEKKQHVEKAKELQKWVSNISKTMRDGEKAEKPLFSKQQVFTEVLLLTG